MAAVDVDTKYLNGSTVLLARFQHARVKPDKAKKLKFSIYSGTHDTEKRILTAQHHDMTYIGSSTDTSSAVSKDLIRLYVGVVDKASKKMSLLPASLTTMSPLQPGDNLRAMLDLSDDEGDEAIEDATAPKTAEEKAQQQFQLVESFGSEKQKRLLASARQSKVDGTDLDLANSLPMVDTQSGEDASSSAAKGVIPAHNPNAGTPSEVYNINDMCLPLCPQCGLVISPTEAANLTRPSKVFQTATPTCVEQWRIDKTYPEYVLGHLPSGESEEDRAVRLYYLAHLINLYRKKRRKSLKQTDFTGVPDVVQQMILSRFTMSSVPTAGDKGVTHVMPDRLRDKLLCHILLLALFIDDFSFDVTVLQKDLQLDSTRISERLRALGCKVSGGGTTKQTLLTATLTIPPNFPKSAKKTRKRKRNT